MQLEETHQEGLYALNPKQREFVFSTEKVCAYYGGVGNGKTLAGALRSLMLCDLYPGNVGLVGRLTYPELRDTTQKQVLDIVRIRNGGSLEPGKYVRSYNQTTGTLTFANGSMILFRYLENEQSILNLNLGFFFVDQAEFIAEPIFNHLLSRLRRWSQEEQAAFYKKFKRTPKHYAFITGNPAPGWVYRAFIQRKTEDGKPLNYTIYQAPTSENRAHLPEGYEENLRASYPKDWVDRYLDGSWSTFQGQVYKEFERPVHVIEPFNIPAHWPRYIGWDHGTTNPTAVSFGAVDEHGNVIIYKEYYQPGAVIKKHADAVLDLCVGDPVMRGDDGKSVIVFMDPSIKGESDGEGRDFRQLYLDYGIVGVPANNSKTAGIEKVSGLLHPDHRRTFPEWHPRGLQKDKHGRIIKEAETGSPGMFIFSTCKAHIHEMELYKYPERRLGEEKNKHEEPVKFMDHAMDALRYLVMAIFDKASPLFTPRKEMERPDHNGFMAAMHKKLLSQEQNAA